MSRPAPAWLAELQARFGAAIRTPLDRSSGTLTATPASYPAELVAGVRGSLAVYNRQYWFRLLERALDAFPLTARLLGAWQFHDYSARFFLATPPRGWDLERATDGFLHFFVDALPPGDTRELLVESAHIDAAWLEVFRAPAVPPFRPSAADAARLLDARLLPAPSVALVKESAPLLALRRRAVQQHSSAALRIPMPPRLAQPRFWALVRTDTGTLQLPLEPREAELHTLLGALPVRAALSRLEGACSPEERAALPARAQAWLARGVQHGFWCGMRCEDEAG